VNLLFLSAARPFNAETDQAAFLAGALAARGHACRWMAPPGAESLARVRAAGLAAAEFPDTHFGNNPVRIAAQLRALRREVRACAPRVLFTVESPTHLLAALAAGWLSGAPATRRAARPAVVRWRGSNTPLRRRPLSRRLYDRATRLVLVPCRALVEAARAAGFATAHWTVVDGCVDLERFAPGPADPAAWAEAELDPGREVVVLVARLAPVKGIPVFLEALARVRRERPGVAGLILGEAWEGQAERLEADVERLGLGGAVRWLGRRADVERWLRLGAVGAVSSVGSELFSRSALEYMAAALPVAATRVGVLPEWLEGRPWARLAAPRDAAGLAAGLLELLGAPERAALGAAARREAESRFAPGRMVDRVEALLRQAAEAA